MQSVDTRLLNKGTLLYFRMIVAKMEKGRG
jgi:hypothetical protein